MQSEVNQEENLNRIITVPNLLSFFRLCLIPVIIWSYCVKNNPLLAGEILWILLMDISQEDSIGLVI